MTEKISHGPRKPNIRVSHPGWLPVDIIEIALPPI
jgi:hypothetical protein